MNDRPKILLASDMTARNDRAFDRAVMLAQEKGGTVELLHVLDDSDVFAQTLSVDEATKRISAQLPPVSVPLRVTVKVGSVPTVIAETAAAIDADLIVAGPARLNNLLDRVLGTAVDYLVRQALVPVLVVKTRAVRRYDNLLAPTDFSSCTSHAISVAAAMLPATQITVLHTFTTPFPSRLSQDDTRPLAQQQAQQSMSEFLASDGLAALGARIKPCIEEGAMVAVISRCARERDIDLLVLGTRGQGAVMHALLRICLTPRLATYWWFVSRLSTE